MYDSVQITSMNVHVLYGTNLGSQKSPPWELGKIPRRTSHRYQVLVIPRPVLPDFVSAVTVESWFAYSAVS